MRWLVALLCAMVLPAAEIHYRKAAEGWTTWAARPEIAPRTWIDSLHSRSGSSLAVSGNSNPAAAGGWETAIPGVEAGRWYRFQACYRTESVLYDSLQVLARLDWTRADGKRAGQPDFVWRVKPDGDWKRVTLEAQAPERATGVKIQLYLLNSPQGTVWWDDVALDSIDAPAARPVRIAAVNYRPKGSKSAVDNLKAFGEAVDRAVSGPSDVILLGEGVTVVGTGKKYADVAQPVPGPDTEKLGEIARRHNSYLVAGVYEREGAAIYNTAVLMDRKGNVAGKYRKVYLPREEVEGGLTPGIGYPVFDTDFGKVGIMICWDLQYADPARALALNGAEVVLLPIWGGSVPLGKARAIENQVFLASSGYDYPTQVLDPNGETLAVASDNGAAALATVDLARRYLDPWLGNMRARFVKELRRDVKVE